VSLSCCSAHPVAQAHLGDSIAVAGSKIEPAHHAAGINGGTAADVLVVGIIATGNSAAPLAEAMAISGGQIIGIGSLAQVEGLANASTKIVKPEGTVIPGLIEPHMHIWTSLLNLTWTDVSHDACATFDDVVSTIKETARKTPAGSSIPACMQGSQI
jgi:predicted amidohydrolase YtcJ